MLNTVIALSLLTPFHIAEPYVFNVECSINDYVYNTSGHMSVTYWSNGETEINQFNNKNENVNHTSLSSDMTSCENKETITQCISDVMSNKIMKNLFFIVEINKLDNTAIYVLVSDGDTEPLQSGTCRVNKQRNLV